MRKGYVFSYLDYSSKRKGRFLLETAAVGVGLLFLAGCAATQVVLEHKDLKVQTKMSATVFLDVENQTERTIYVDFKNTSGKPINIEDMIKQRLIAKGYQRSESTGSLLHSSNKCASGRHDRSLRSAGIPLCRMGRSGRWGYNRRGNWSSGWREPRIRVWSCRWWTCWCRGRTGSRLVG